MRCQHIERLIIESTERAPTKPELDLVDAHKSICPSCRRFSEDYSRLSLLLPQARLPKELDGKTRRTCLRELRSGMEPGLSRSRSRSVPGLVWTALPVLVVMTGLSLIPALEEIGTDSPLSLSTLTVLTILLQNAAMLIFAPILIRKHRKYQPIQSGCRAMPKPV